MTPLNLASVRLLGQPSTKRPAFESSSKAVEKYRRQHQPAKARIKALGVRDPGVEMWDNQKVAQKYEQIEHCFT
jgi:hypothetical protein